MKQSMMYELNQTHLLKMWQFQTTRQNHIRRLNTIYQDKGKLRKHQEEVDGHRKGYMALHMKNKEIDNDRKHKMEQSRINYENQILRNKLIDASIPRSVQNKDKTYSTQQWKCEDMEVQKAPFTGKRNFSVSENYLRRMQKDKITHENAKMFIKLATIKSDLKTRLNIKNHQQQTQTLKEKLQRHSPQRRKELRSFFRKKHINFGRSLMPISIKSELNNHNNSSVDNEEEDDILY